MSGIYSKSLLGNELRYMQIPNSPMRLRKGAPPTPTKRVYIFSANPKNVFISNLRAF